MSDSESNVTPEGDLVQAWEALGEREIFTCPIFDLVARRLRHPIRSSEAEFYVLKTRDWVMVIPLTADNKVVMVRQYRFGIEETSWEFPGGIIDDGEDPVAGGVRELREETGFVSESCSLIGSVAANPAILDNRCHFVWADGVTLEEVVDWDEHEEMETRLIDVDEVFSMAHRGEIKHSLAVAALFQFYPQWLKIKSRRR